MKREHINEIKGITISAVAVVFLISLLSSDANDLFWYTSHPNIPTQNWIGIFGAYLAAALFFVLGYSAYVFVALLFFWSWDKFSSKDLEFSSSKFIIFIVMFCTVSALCGMVGSQIPTLQFQRAGLVGIVIADFLVKYFDRTGAFVILIALALVSMVVIAEFLVSPFLFRIADLIKESLISTKEKNLDKKESISALARIQIKPAASLREKLFKKQQEQAGSKAIPVKEQKPSENKTAVPTPPSKPQIHLAPTLKEEHKALVNEPRVVGEYHLPSLELLNEPPPLSSRKLQDNLMAGAKILEETLADFGVIVRVADIERGPVITRYELEPAPGVKVGQITSLSDDIALTMKAQTVRIVAPIPGKNRVGVEVPNDLSSTVYLKDVLTKSEFRSSKSKLMLALGKDITGQPLIADLAGMPHLLIAGTTGAGKTVCVNSIIISMLFNATPDEVKFLMVDPKMVELSCYNNIPHSLCPAVTDPKKVSAALTWLVGEMESRYVLLSKEGVRNIEGYNAKEFRLPYIVVIIDELADLMQIAAREIEGAITRLAQLSRAVGIHLILATQRPSVDVITGVIKANFPARVSFKVASKVDSRTVLDTNGADKLLGKGDMLFMKPGEAKPIRGQCSLVSDEEIQRVVDFIKVQRQPVYNENIVKQQTAVSRSPGAIEHDDLYDDALRIVMETNHASVTILQRRMGLGYSRAARIVDLMERRGMIGPYLGSKPREILIDREEWLKTNSLKQQPETTTPTQNG